MITFILKVGFEHDKQLIRCFLTKVNLLVTGWIFTIINGGESWLSRDFTGDWDAVNMIQASISKVLYFLSKYQKMG